MHIIRRHPPASPPRRNTPPAHPRVSRSEEDKAAILAELAHAKLTVPLPVRPGAAHAAARRRSQSSDDSLNEEQLQSLADKLGAGKTLSKGQMDQMAEKIVSAPRPRVARSRALAEEAVGVRRSSRG